MNIKNYTSGVAAERSISKIESILMDIGATNINKQYENKRLIGVTFIMPVNGNTLLFRLPAKADSVVSALKKTYKRLTPSTLRTITEQAEKTAWKICCDWVEIQATLIKLEQAEFIEVFLPYVYSVERQQTFFETIKEKSYRALLN